MSNVNNNGGLSDDELVALATGGTIPQPQVETQTTTQTNTVDFTAQLQRQQPVVTNEAVDMTATKPTLGAGGTQTSNSILNTTQRTIQGNDTQDEDGPIKFNGPGLDITPVAGEEEASEPEANAESYIETMEDTLNDPEVRKIIKNMEPFVPQLGKSLGSTAELDDKYSEELKEKEKLDPIYQGTVVDTYTELDEKGNEVQKQRLVSKSSVYDEGVPTEELTEVGSKYREAVVHIDKFNKTNVEFTPEEKAKLTHSSKIILEEIEEIDLRQVTRRKMPDNVEVSSVSPLRANTHNNTTVPLLSSGLVTSFDGCPPLEVMGLGIDPNMPVHQRTQIYADFLFKHLKSTSIGEKISREDFDKISYNDMEMMFYGVVCSTYPDMDYLPVICRSEACKGEKEYQHYYSTRSLLRVERLHEDALEAMSTLSELTTTLEARRAHANSSAMQTKTFRLPENRAIVSISSTSIGEFIKRMVVMQGIPQEFVFAGTSAIYVKQVLIPPAGNEDLKAPHMSIEDTERIVEFVQGLSALDLSVIQEMIGRIQENIVPEFGLFDLTCPHCGEHSELRELNPSELLFFRVEQEMNRPVEVKGKTPSSKDGKVSSDSTTK